MATTWPKVELPLTCAMAPTSRSTSGSALGSMSPCLMLLTYWMMRMNPWESCPARLALARCVPTILAWPSDAPAACSTSLAMVLILSAVIVGITTSSAFWRANLTTQWCR